MSITIAKPAAAAAAVAFTPAAHVSAPAPALLATSQVQLWDCALSTAITAFHSILLHRRFGSPALPIPAAELNTYLQRNNASPFVHL